MIFSGDWVFPIQKKYSIASQWRPVEVLVMVHVYLLDWVDVSAVSPYRYTRIIFGMLTGVIIFGEQIDALTIVGTLIIVIAGLYGWSRERAHSAKFISENSSWGTIASMC